MMSTSDLFSKMSCLSTHYTPSFLKTSSCTYAKHNITLQFSFFSLQDRKPSTPCIFLRSVFSLTMFSIGQTLSSIASIDDWLHKTPPLSQLLHTLHIFNSSSFFIQTNSNHCHRWVGHAFQATEGQC